MLLAPVAVGLTLKLSPAATGPLPFKARVNPSITGGGVVVVSNEPMALPSERTTLYWLPLVKVTL